MLALNYGPAVDPLAALRAKDRGAISVYARNRDYHEVVKGKLKTLAAWLVAAAASRGGRRQGVRRHRAGDGEAARRGGGPRLAGQAHQSRQPRIRLLAVPRRDLHRPRPAAGRGRERSLRRTAAPASTPARRRAFPAPYQLDARRCISYLTIEHKGPIARELRAAIGNRIYGCDDCLAVCPWNKFARIGARSEIAGARRLAAPPLAELAALDDAGFRAHFAGGPIKRIGHARFLRNVMIAIGNSGDVSPRAAGGGAARP